MRQCQEFNLHKFEVLYSEEKENEEEKICLKKKTAEIFPTKKQ